MKKEINTIMIYIGMNGDSVMKKKLLIGILAFIGIITTIKLAIIYYESNFNPYALSSFCSINDLVDCDGAAKSTTSQFLGIPLAYWGMSFYLLILFLLFIDNLKQIKFLSFLSVFKRPTAYISVLGLISFFISVFLAIKSVFILHKICILCFVSYILNTLIALIATDFENGGFIKSIKISIEDFISGIKKYTKVFIIALIIGSSFLTYTTIANPFTPQVKKHKSIQSYLKMTTNPYSITGNNLGNPDATHKIELFSDFSCPMCFAYNIMIHQAVKELGDIYIDSHNLPLDRKCNKYLRKQIHKNSCQLAKYAIAAKNQEKYWDMSTLLFEHTPKTDIDAIMLAQKLGLNVEQFKNDIKSKETADIILKDIDYAVSKGIIATPTIIVNGEKYVGIKPYYELKDILKKKVE